MRIVTWNCQMGLEKKADNLLFLAPDIAVVPECSESSAVKLRQCGYQALWFGCNPHKGLGVFCRKEWTIRALGEPEQKWIVPIEVSAPTPFRLLAVWACQVGVKKADNYIGQVYQSLISHLEWLNRAPVVVAGDLNSNKIWDTERPVENHSAVVKILKECGVVSAYHEYFGEPHGEESRPTTYLYRHEDKPFHIDYVFIPGAWLPRLQSVEVGGHGQWCKLSDHCPIIVELKD